MLLKSWEMEHNRMGNLGYSAMCSANAIAASISVDYVFVVV